MTACKPEVAEQEVEEGGGAGRWGAEVPKI